MSKNIEVGTLVSTPMGASEVVRVDGSHVFVKTENGEWGWNIGEVEVVTCECCGTTGHGGDIFIRPNRVGFHRMTKRGSGISSPYILCASCARGGVVSGEWECLDDTDEARQWKTDYEFAEEARRHLAEAEYREGYDPLGW